MWVPDNILRVPDSRFGVAENKVPAPKNDLGLPENKLMGATKQTKLEIPENKVSVVGD